VIRPFFFLSRVSLSTDRVWKRYGDQNPYYGVLTDPRYLADRMTDESRAAFFSTGDAHVVQLLDLIFRVVNPEFVVNRVLDFGCGVGRLAIPFARHAQGVDGMDISASMLKEARVNAAHFDVDNVAFLESDDELTEATGLYSLVHSYVVLQHVPLRRGMRLLGQLIDRIEPGGVGAFHVTYGSELSRGSRAFRRIRLLFPPLHWAVNIVRGRPLRTPMMQMNLYDLGNVVRAVQTRGEVNAIHVQLTEHSGFLGAFIFFQRPYAAQND